MDASALAVAAPVGPAHDGRRATAVREVFRAFGLSRALVWTSGILIAVLLGPARLAAFHLNHLHLATPFETNLIVALVPLLVVWTYWFVSWTYDA